MTAEIAQSGSGFLRKPGEHLPPARPGVRHVRLPRVGTVVADEVLRQRVDQVFYWPMIVLALLILPLLVLDHFFLARGAAGVDGDHWLYFVVHAGFAVIWLAFLVEFVVKISIAECRIEYVKRNWLDLIIILVPVLRPIRAAYLARTTRVFTLRGVGMKFARYVFTMVIGLEATERLLHRVGLKVRRERKDPAALTRFELVDEVRRLRKLSDAWETWYQAHQEQHARRGDDVPLSPPPSATESAETDSGPEPEPSDPAAGAASVPVT